MKSPGLNPAQHQAVEHQVGPILVLAGAGSGKTRVITHRIVRRMERGVPASAIVALTFTNKAAAEMAERVHGVMKERGMRVSAGAGAASRGARGERGLTVSTFHSFGLAVLTRERRATGSAFTIFDQGDCLGVVKEVLRTMDAGKRFDVPAIAARISNAKNAFQTAEEMPDSDDPYEEITKLVYPRYQSALRNYAAFDFDDLVCEVARTWMDRPDVLSRWQDRYQYILVDEYQDTNRAQLEVLRLLAARHKNICVVGDDDQSIYAWRGADVRNILEFEEHFPGAAVVKLEQNYRSCKAIIEVANAVIAKRQDARHDKRLFTDRDGAETMEMVVAETPEAEAGHVARELKRFIRDEKKRPKEMAVLYRSNGQAKAIEEALRSEQVPYRLVGGQQFFERKEVKDILSYLKLALNRSDEISLRRVMNYPARGIGETSVERLALHAVAKGWTLWQAIERVDALDDISGSAREGCKDLERVVGDLRKQLLVDRSPSTAVTRMLCERIGLKQEIDASSPTPQVAAKRWANVESLLVTFARREAKDALKADAGADTVSELAAFLHALTLDFGEDEENAGDVVTLSTLHGSKGLEFEVVFLIGCEEGYLPHSRTIDLKANDISTTASTGKSGSLGSDSIEEERRLFYVGVTRAKDILVLSRCRARSLRGKPVPRTPSRFLMDMPKERIVEIAVKEDPSLATAAMAANANAFLAMLEGLGK
jgi:DNA helicase-2/ATP-dependent DNA helicase PcrA